MTPQQRLHQALELNAMVRELLAAGFRQRHPDWTQTQVEAAVARRIRDADTG